MKSLINTESWSKDIVIVDDPNDVVQQSFGTYSRDAWNSVRKTLMGGWMLVGPQKTRIVMGNLCSGDLGYK